MKHKRFLVEQIVTILKQAEMGNWRKVPALKSLALAQANSRVS